MREKLDCEMELVTPMFMAGTDQRSCELRAQSIKGLLRFWWRAFKFGEIKGDLKALKEAEGEIFGHVGDKAKKSSFSLSVSIGNATPPDLGKMPSHPVPVKGKNFTTNILEYLCYGTHAYNKAAGRIEFIRGRFAPAQRFALTLRFNRNESINDIAKALYLLIEFGGGGSRSHNGFGSIRLLNKEALATILGKEFGADIFANRMFWDSLTSYKQLPAFTAFSNGAEVFRTKSKDYTTWDACLADMGKAYRECRSDERLEPRHTYDKRQYLGAPLDPPKEPFKSILGRHAKPYFMKVAKDAAGKHSGSILYLPHAYGPSLDKDRQKHPFDAKKQTEQFQRVCNEFNQLLSKDTRLEVVK